MVRRRARFPGVPENGDSTADEEEEDGDDVVAPATVEDLIQEDTFQDRRGSVTIPPDDVPLEVDALPIPKPWQGIQRAAVVFNLNFVYDTEEEEWIRDEGNGGGSPVKITWAYLSSNQDITAGKTQNVQLDAVETNDLGFDTSTTTFTVSDPGYYLIQAQVYFFETDLDTAYGMEVREQVSNLNSEDIISSAARTGGGANADDLSIGGSGVLSLDGSNELRLVARNEGTNNRQLLGAKANTYLRVARLGDRQ